VGEADNSVFTRHVLAGLRTGAADTDGDGRITLDELYDYVYEQVVSQTPKQTPRKFAYNQQGEVVLALNPGARPKPAALPQDLLFAVNSSLAGVREGAVRELEQLLRSAQPGLVLAARETLERLAADDSRRVSAAAQTVLDAFTAAHPPPPIPAAKVEPVRPPSATPAAHTEPPATAPSPLPAVNLTPPSSPSTPAEQPARVAPEAAHAAAVSKPMPPAAQPARSEAAGVGAAPRAAVPDKPASLPSSLARQETSPAQAALGGAIQPPAWQSVASHRPSAAPVSAQPQSTPVPNLERPSTSAPAAPPSVAQPMPSVSKDSLAAASPAGLLVPWPVAMVLMAVGCAVAYAVAAIVFDAIRSLPGETFYPSILAYWLIAHTMTGLTLGLVLRLRRPALSFSRVVGMAAAWAAASALGWMVFYIVVNQATEVAGQLAGLTIVGLFGGRAVGAVLYPPGDGRAPRSPAVLVIAGGWVVALCLTMLVDWASGWNVPALIIGAVTGLMGGAVVARHLTLAGREPSSWEASLSQILAAPSTPIVLLALGCGVAWLSGDFVSETIVHFWSDAPQFLLLIVSVLVVGGVSGLAAAAVIGIVKQPLGLSGMLFLFIIWAAAGLPAAAITFALSQVSLDGNLPSNLVYGLVGGAATTTYLARRLRQPRSLRLIMISAVAWAVALVVAGLVFDAWYDWSNHFIAGAVTALGSIPIFLSMDWSDERLT
jgi:hypothetical protein